MLKSQCKYKITPYLNFIYWCESSKGCQLSREYDYRNSTCWQEWEQPRIKRRCESSIWIMLYTRVSMKIHLIKERTYNNPVNNGHYIDIIMELKLNNIHTRSVSESNCFIKYEDSPWSGSTGIVCLSSEVFNVLLGGLDEISVPVLIVKNRELFINKLALHIYDFLLNY